MDLENLRREYRLGGLQRDQLSDDPMLQFRTWLQEAIDFGISDPSAMTLATASRLGQPSQRIVLLKGSDANSLIFYTNYGSRKAQDLEENPLVSAHFPWYPMDRQISCDGSVDRLDREASERYFASRPRESQIAAWASAQSSRIESREALLQRFKDLQEQFENTTIPLPDFWGGFRLTPHRFEFWQGGEHRLHDRFEYIRERGGWTVNRLAP